MARPEIPIKTTVIEELRDARRIASNDADWHRLRDAIAKRYPQVSMRSLQRWCSEAQLKTARSRSSKRVRLENVEHAGSGEAVRQPLTAKSNVGGRTDRFVKPPPAPDDGAMDLVQRTADLYLDAVALRDCSMREIEDGSGHVITDAASYTASIELRRKIVALQIQMLEKANDLHAVEQFCKALINRIGARDRLLATQLIADMRVISKEYGANTWKAPAST